MGSGRIRDGAGWLCEVAVLAVMVTFQGFLRAGSVVLVHTSFSVRSLGAAKFGNTWSPPTCGFGQEEVVSN